MYYKLLSAIIIFFPLAACIQDIWSLSVKRIIWIIGIPLAFCVHAFCNYKGLLVHAQVMLVSFAFYFLIRLVTHKGLGFADVLMGAFMGSVLSLRQMIYAVIFQLMISFFYYGVAFIIARMKSHKIPFIPVMAVSLWVVWFAM